MGIKLVMAMVVMVLVCSQENDKFIEENWLAVSLSLGLIDRLQLQCLFKTEATLYKILSFPYFMKLDAIEFLPLTVLTPVLVEAIFKNNRFSSLSELSLA